MRAGGDVDDPGGAAGLPLLLVLAGALEAGHQEVREQHVALKELKLGMFAHLLDRAG